MTEPNAAPPTVPRPTMMLGQTVDQVARVVVYIHPALSEAVENALLDLR